MNKVIVAVAALALGAYGLFAEEHKEMVKIGGEGKFVVVNAAGVDDALLQKAVGKLGSILLIEVEVKNGTWNLADAKKCLADTKGKAAVFVVKDEKLPMSLIAIEEKWGVANVFGLSDVAITRETMRVSTIVLGGASSKYAASAMRPVFSASDLEQKAGDLITIDSLMAIYPNLDALGFKQYEPMEYIVALEDGVAPPPANEAQRKIKAEFDARPKK